MITCFPSIVRVALFSTLATLLLVSPAAAEKKPVFDAKPVGDPSGKIEDALDAQTEVQYLDTQLHDVITDLELRHDIPIELDEVALTADGKGPDVLISRTLKGVPLATALDLILHGEGLIWSIRDGVLLVTTQTAEPNYTQLKVYGVGDMGGDLDSLVVVVTESIAPESWRATGGGVGTIAVHADTKSLVITQTSRNHRQIMKLFEKLRIAKADDGK